jgi:hypothetical protein
VAKRVNDQEARCGKMQLEISNALFRAWFWAAREWQRLRRESTATQERDPFLASRIGL